MKKMQFKCMVKLKGKLSGICTMVWADLDSLFSAVCVVRWSLKKNMHCFCHYFTIMKRKKKLQNYGKYSSLLGNLSNYHSIGTQTHWGQCHLVPLDVISQCFDYPIISGPASCLKHVFWILLCWGCVYLFSWYKYLPPLLEWEDSNTLWGLMVPFS